MNLLCRLRRLFAWLVLGVSLGAGNAVAEAPVLDVSLLDRSSVSLTPYFEVLEDAGATLTLANAQQVDLANRFRPSAARELNFGYTTSAYWLRLTLHNPTAAPLTRMLEISNAQLRNIEFYAPAVDGVVPPPVLTGVAMPFSAQAYPNHFFVFPLHLPANSTATYHLRFKSFDSLFIPAVLWAPDAFHAHERNDYVAQSLYFGWASGFILFNLLLFVVMKEVIYLLYVGSNVCFLMLCLTQFGFSKEFLWPEVGHWATVAYGVFGQLFSVAFLMFMRHFLNLKALAPKLDWCFKWVAVLCMLCLLNFASDTPVMWSLLMTPFLTIVLVVVTAVYAVVCRQRAAYFFMGAFGLGMVGAIVSFVRPFGLLPTTVLTANGLQMGSALEMLLLAFALADRFNQIRKEKEVAQQEGLAAQLALVKTLKESEQVLEQRVEQRTASLEATLLDLKATQSQLVQSEKMASLGQLVANVAHEINTPIGAVKSSSKSISDALPPLLKGLPRLFELLDGVTRQLFFQLIDPIKKPTEVLNTRQERALTRELSQQLQDAGVADARSRAEILVQLHAQGQAQDYLPLLQHAECPFILEEARSIATIVSSASNINAAVDQVSKIVFALKSFSRLDSTGEHVESSLRDGIDTVLTLYQSQIRQGTELVLSYDDLPLVSCVPDQLNQVWTNLIHNALQAMKYAGTLTVTLRREQDEAVVTIADTGCGIPEAIREKIFDAFFTTKPIGEGSGLGLDIVKKIIDKHQGRIQVVSEVGVGSTFSVYLPLRVNPPGTELHEGLVNHGCE